MKDGWLVIFIYLLLLPVAHLSNAPRRQLVVMGDSARVQHKPRFNVSSERQSVILVG